MQDKKIESHTVFFTSVRALLFVTPKLWLASSLTAPVLNILGILLYCLFVMHLKPLYCSHIFSKEIVVVGVFFFFKLCHKKKSTCLSLLFSLTDAQIHKVCAQWLRMQCTEWCTVVVSPVSTFSLLHCLLYPLENYYRCYKLYGKSSAAKEHGAITVL